jgi:AsmA family protein
VRVIGWNWARNYVEQQITVATGHELTIARGLEFNLSLKPFIRVEKVRLKSASWDRFTNMAEIGALALRIDLIELMQGRIVIPELSMRAPVVHLAISARGKPNWRLGSDSPPRTARKSKQEVSLPVIHRVVMQAGKITYRDFYIAM